MKQLGYIRIFFQALIFPLLPYKKRKKIQKKRLKKLVRHVKSNSPYFARLYKDIGEDFNLSDLPITTKEMMMENFDDWITDSSINWMQVDEFKRDKSNIGHRIKNKYMVAETYGSTGYPATMLHDKTHQNVESVLSFLRALRFRLPICCICVDDDFGVFNGTVRQNAIRYPFVKKFMRIINAKKHPQQMVEELNEFKPGVVIGYPGTLELLTDEAYKAKLKIKPSLVLVSGEYLSDMTRAKLTKTFGCPVRSIYASTEGGTMAFECRYNRMHINEDWCILEPVDEENRPVAMGERSSKVLLTNLSNFTQPIIRYELTDRVIIHDEPCPCGKKGLWLEVEGRTSDVLYFRSNGIKIGVAPMSLADTIEVIPGVRNFQVVLHPNNEIELRLVCMKNADPAETFQRVKQRVTEYLYEFGISDFSIYLSKDPPRLHPKSGKFKQIYQIDDGAQDQ